VSHALDLAPAEGLTQSIRSGPEPVEHTGYEEAMMKRVFLVGILVGALAATGTAFAGAAPMPTTTVSGTAAGTAATMAGQAPKMDRLATVRITRKVTANGEPLAPGTYTLVLDGEGPAVEGGQGVERWVEFHKGREVKGKELASIIPVDKISEVSKDPNKPKPGRARVEMLKGGEYLRIWVNRGGDNYLIHLPIAK
jgi:hypothetical protein